MGISRRAAAVALSIGALVAYVALPAGAADAATGNELLVSDATPFDQQAVDAVFTGTGWFVVWAERRSAADGTSVFGERVELDGTRLDGTGILISAGEGANSASASNPSVAVGKNGQLLVAWDNRDGLGQDVLAVRLDASGLVLDADPLPIATGPTQDSSPSVASNGETFLVAFSRVESPSTNTRAALVEADGVEDLGQVAKLMSTPQVAASGGKYLIVGSRNADGITGRRLAGNGSTLGSAFAITGNDVPGRQLTPAVAGGSDGWFVVWTDERNERIGAGDLFGARVSSAGAVVDTDGGFEVAGFSGSQDLPRVAVQGGTALVAWRDRRTSETIVFGSRVSGDTVDDPDGFPISGGTVGAVALGPSNGFTVAYDRAISGPPFNGADRGVIRTVSAK